MPRPNRNWTKLTLTLSPEVCAALRVAAARETGATGEVTYMGSLADRILRAELLPQGTGAARTEAQPKLAVKSAGVKGAQQHSKGAASAVPKSRPAKPAPAPQRPVAPSPRALDPEALREEGFFTVALACAEATVGLGPLVERLASCRSFEAPDVPEMRKEFEAWRRAKRIPKAWQPDVFFALNQHEMFTRFFAREALAPDTFFYGEED
jgi:hypothetical protein